MVKWSIICYVNDALGGALKQLGFTFLLGYKFICDCGKSLSCPFYSRGKDGIIADPFWYKQCENCGRIYRISLGGTEKSEEELLTIDDLMRRIAALTVEASSLPAQGKVELLYDPTL